VPDLDLLAGQEYGIARLIFEGPPDSHPKVDVFLDALPMSHRLDFRDRLILESPTVPLADLLLSKLQIHELTEKDIQDVIVLVSEHEFGLGNVETFDMPYLLAILRNDWGFFHEVVSNIAAISAFLRRYLTLDSSVISVVNARLSELLDRLVSEPKTSRWKIRSRLGVRLPWYEDVSDVDR
jgi:hypothetical protein